MSEIETKKVKSFVSKCPTEGATKEEKTKDWTLRNAFVSDKKGGAYMPDDGNKLYAGTFPDKIPLNVEFTMTFREKYTYNDATAAETGVKFCYAITGVKVGD